MRKIFICLILLLLFSCEENYKTISSKDFKNLVIQDTLLDYDNQQIYTVGKSKSDDYPKILVKKERLYLFERDSELVNDSTILHYYSAFIIDSQGAFRKNGIWVYTQFYQKGVFPFRTNERRYDVDSIPEHWNGKSPTQEGIYFYENNVLKLFSKEQSEKKFSEYKKDGFYFIPNKGRLFDKINLNQLK